MPSSRTRSRGRTVPRRSHNPWWIAGAILCCAAALLRGFWPGQAQAVVSTAPMLGGGALTAGPGFTGEYQFPNDQTYLRARSYDPALGRFSQRDPLDTALLSIAYPAGAHRYAYANNTPTMFIDPSGFAAKAPAAAPRPAPESDAVTIERIKAENAAELERIKAESAAEIERIKAENALKLEQEKNKGLLEQQKQKGEDERALEEVKADDMVDKVVVPTVNTGVGALTGACVAASQTCLDIIRKVAEATGKVPGGIVNVGRNIIRRGPKPILISPIGLLDDLGTLQDALDCGRSFGEQVQHDLRDGKNKDDEILWTPLGPIPNPYHPNSPFPMEDGGRGGS